MKSHVLFLIAVFTLFPALNCIAAQSYRIEALQVSNIEPYNKSYQGFVEELKKGGLVEGKNVTITRHVIDADVDASIWEKISILLKVKKEAGKIVESKPNLVLTIGTVASKYSMGKFIDAGIPMVFTAVANPQVLGCKDFKTPGKGFTGATLYLDPLSVLTLSKMAYPKLKTLAMVSSDDDNGIAFIEESKKRGVSLGITIISKQVKKSASIKQAAAELSKAGADAFGIPLDTYYGLRNDEPARDIAAFCREKNLPIFAYMDYTVKGATLYVGANFHYNGRLSGMQAMKIIGQGVKPETLPILRQDDLMVYIDQERLDNFGIKLPPQVQKISKQAVFE